MLMTCIFPHFEIDPKKLAQRRRRRCLAYFQRCIQCCCHTHSETASKLFSPARFLPPPDTHSYRSVMTSHQSLTIARLTSFSVSYPPTPLAFAEPLLFAIIIVVLFRHTHHHLPRNIENWSIIFISFQIFPTPSKQASHPPAQTNKQHSHSHLPFKRSNPGPTPTPTRAP